MEHTIALYRKIEIVTSGYSDRYVSCRTHYRITTYGERSAVIRTEDRDNAVSYLENCGIAFDTAYDMVRDAETIATISGWKTSGNSPCHIQKRINADTERSIATYLAVNGYTGSYTAEAIDRMRAELAANPLSDEIMALVQWQIAECDRRNTAIYGYPDRNMAVQR